MSFALTLLAIGVFSFTVSFLVAAGKAGRALFFRTMRERLATKPLTYWLTERWWHP